MDTSSKVTPPISIYRSEQFLIQHIQSCMNFYQNSMDTSEEDAGFFHYFDDCGAVVDSSHRHLVSSTRFVFTNAIALKEFGEEKYKLAVEHGLRYIRTKHRNADTGGYCWTIRDGNVEDSTYHCYGVAFVLLAYSKALDIGIDVARDFVEETWELLERYYWDDENGLYRDEADCAWVFSSYRGQNANMHMCEALLATYIVCNEKKYINRAILLAQNMTQRQSRLTGTQFVWEHYDKDWSVDWSYNIENPKHVFRPWGFQSGHQIQWAKLCLLLYRQNPSMEWLKSTAESLFHETISVAWDTTNGGVYYGFSPDKQCASGKHKICDSDKYFWVQSEAIATAALLAIATQSDEYWSWYESLWQYVDKYFVDHTHGAWYNILNSTNEKLSNIKSPAGKADYHSMGACYDVLAALRLRT